MANGFQPTLIEKLSKKIKKGIDSNKKKNNNQTDIRTVCLPNFGIISQKIANAMRPYDVRIVFSTKRKLGYNLHHYIKTKNDKFSNSGVYKIKCKQCPTLYVGQTGRSFQTRFKEHINASETTHPINLQ